jgi:3-methyladenine DNA glycosylase AlkD
MPPNPPLPTAPELADRFARALRLRRQPEKVAGMEAYMRHRFAFLGVPAPGQRDAYREAAAGLPRALPQELVVAVADDLWARPGREHKYLACRLVNRQAESPGATADLLAALERLLTTEPWWDTVDSLATHAVGGIVRRHPGERTTMERWLEGDDLWLTRSALLHMNRWKAGTDRDWLFAACLRRAAHPDFFIRKAIGWALREHSKVDAAAVVAFVDDHADELSGLSRREALMWLERRRRRAAD